MVVVYPCYHCWFTNSFKDPYTCTFSVVLLLLMLGMMKMLCMFCCCRTSDGRYVDIAALLLGTASEEHTKAYVNYIICTTLKRPLEFKSLSTFFHFRKKRSATFQFLLGACFFFYLPLLPCVISFCSWRRRAKARERLKKKAARKMARLKEKKQAGAAMLLEIIHTLTAMYYFHCCFYKQLY